MATDEKLQLAYIRSHLIDRLRVEYPACQPLQVNVEVHQSGPTLVCEIYLWGERLYKILDWNATRELSVQRIVQWFFELPGFREFFVFAAAGPIPAPGIESYLWGYVDEFWPSIGRKAKIKVNWVPNDRRFVVICTCEGEQFTFYIDPAITPEDSEFYIGMQITGDPIFNEFFNKFAPLKPHTPVTSFKTRRLIKA